MNVSWTKVSTTLFLGAVKVLFPRYYASDLEEFLSSIESEDWITLSIGDKHAAPINRFAPNNQTAYIHARIDRKGVLPFRQMVIDVDSPFPCHIILQSQADWEEKLLRFRNQACLQREELREKIMTKIPEDQIILLHF